MAVFVKIVPAAALFVAVASSLGAQDSKLAPSAAPACDAAQPTSGNGVRANISLQQALKDQKTNPASSAKSLTTAVKTVENDKDPGSSYVLGSALALWMNQPGVGYTPKRGALGFTTNPEATIDLPTAIDSVFKIVEATKPGCSYYTAYWRGGQQAYLDLVNGAIAALNADKLDSAQAMATMANRLYPASPYGTMVLGNIANKRKNDADAIKYWRTAANAAGSDTAYRDVQRQVLGNIASVYLNSARDASASKAAQVEAAKQAAATYNELLAIPGTKGTYLSGGRQNLQAALLIAGDTATITKSYQDLIANPGNYEYQDLLNSAVSAARANRSADAAKLFEAVLKVNPYSRDALYNLGVVYLSLDQNDKVAPVVNRLIAVDPGHPDNYLLAARAFAAMAKTAKKGSPAAAALNDSTVTWYNKGTKLPVDVSFTEFSPSETQLVVAGNVLDRRDIAASGDEPAAAPAKGAKTRAAAKPAAKSANLSPKPVTLTFEALDKNGTVLGTKSVTTEALQPGKTAVFNVTIPGANAVAYRYKVSD